MSNIKMNNFEQSIDSIRNILRTEGITGMESINHCVLFIIFSSLSESKCVEYNIPKQYAFEKFKYDEQTKKDLLTNDQKLFDKFFLKDKECLIKQIKQKLGFSQINFKIKSLQYFEKIYKILESLNINNLEENFDIIGIIYELHLRSGSTGSGMRDLGQYFTNRLVIEYMVKLCNPKVKENGEIEKILDPSMGTGGFLTMSIKHLNENNKNINWNANKNNIYGFDIDENLKNLALLNVLLETGKDFKKTMVQCDSLKNDYLVDKDNKTVIDKVDIILANEPFGLKNIIHADCCDRIKDLKIRGTKGEPLFLQLMMLSLNKGGRCAVVVPDGVLFNDAKLHKDTRKYLCEKLNLKKVVSLEDGLFLNTGVKSSILFFVNDGETEEVEFCKIKMSNGGIVEELIIKVDIEEINENDYSLFVNKYNIIEEEKIEGLEYKKLKEILKDISTTKTISSNDRKNGLYRFFSCSKDESTHNTFDYEGSYLIHGSRGSTIDESIFITQNEKFSICTSVFLSEIINSNLYNLKYVYYYLKHDKEKINKLITTTAIPMISKTTYYDIEIPIPPLSLQQQIVEALDSIYDTIEENNKLIKNYEKIKKGIIWSNTLNVDKKIITDLCDIKCGAKMNLQDYLVDKSDYKIIRTRNINYNEDFLFINKDGYNLCKNCLLKEGDIIMTSFVDNFDCQLVDNYYKNSTFNGGIFRLNNFKINNKYFINYLKTDNFRKELENMSIGSTVKMFNVANLSNINIPIPSKQIQEHIVKECEYYDNLIETLKKENERLQNNKIIDMVLKSVSNEIDDQYDEILEDESEEIQPTKITKETTKVKEILKQVIEKEALDEPTIEEARNVIKESNLKNKEKAQISLRKKFGAKKEETNI